MPHPTRRVNKQLYEAELPSEVRPGQLHKHKLKHWDLPRDKGLQTQCIPEGRQQKPEPELVLCLATCQKVWHIPDMVFWVFQESRISLQLFFPGIVNLPDLPEHQDFVAGPPSRPSSHKIMRVRVLGERVHYFAQLQHRNPHQDKVPCTFYYVTQSSRGTKDRLCLYDITVPLHLPLCTALSSQAHKSTF